MSLCLDPRNTHEKKFGPAKYTRKFFKPTKYPREKILDLRNIHEKKKLDTRNTHEKKIGPAKYPREKIWTHEIHTIKIFEPTKYPQEQILDPRRHGGTMA